MADVIQPSFGKGVVSPDLYGRVDTTIYKVALRRGDNFFVHITGGASNRQGFMFVAPVKDHTNSPELIPFEFKDEDTYCLEFGDLYMRVIRNDGHVLEATVAISGATQADPVVVTTGASHGYSTGDEVFIDGVVGMTELNGRRFVINVLTATTFELTDQVTGADIDGTGFTAYSSGGTVARVFTLTTPYAIADVPNIAWVQSADVVTLVHPSYAPRELTRTDHDAWTLTEITFAPSVADPTTVAVTPASPSSGIEDYTVTAWGADEIEESLQGVATANAATISGATQANPVVITTGTHGFSDDDEVEIAGIVGMTELNGRRFLINVLSATTFELRGEDGTGHTAYSSGGTATPTFFHQTNSAAIRDNTITWDEVTGASKYSVYRKEGGGFAWIGDTEALSFRDDNIDADKTISPPSGRNPFNAAGDYPASVSYHEQRRVFGGTDNRPDTAFYSATGAHSNMSFSRPVKASDAITASLNSRKVNRIRHFSPLEELIVHTKGSEWRVSAGADVGFSADTLKQKPQSEFGIANVPPLLVGETILYVEDGGQSVRSFGFELTIDKYTGSDMTQLAKHLFEFTEIVRWGFMRRPYNLIVAVLADGTIGCLTFDKEQQTVAWCPWQTKGSFESVATMQPSASDNFDAAYVVVKRKVNGQTVRYIERTVDRRIQNIKDAFFVDSGLSLDSPIAISGITSADPVVVTTTAAHGLSNGDEVDLSDIVWETQYDAFDNASQPAQLNGGRFTIANKTATTFELQDRDGNDIDGSAFVAYVEGGNARLAVATISGLRHLAGETVIALADGNVVKNLTVSADGQITLATKASRVHVGLKYVSDFQTLDLEPSAQTTLQGRKMSVGRMTVRLKDSRGLWYGASSDDLYEMKQREDEAFDEPIAMLTGDKELAIPGTWEEEGRVFLRQRDPLPLTILAVIPDFEVADDD